MTATIVHLPIVGQDGMTREQLRSRRPRDIRSKTVSMTRLTKRELELGRAMYPDVDEPRPRTRGDCVNGIRPCPWVSCAHHLYLDVSDRTDAIKMNFPDLEPDELEETCSLDVADRGGVTLEQVGALVNITRDRIRQIEAAVMEHLKRKAKHLRGDLDRGVERAEQLREDGDDVVTGGGTAGNTSAKWLEMTDEERADDDFVERAWRIYERESRERQPRPSEDGEPKETKETTMENAISLNDKQQSCIDAARELIAEGKAATLPAIAERAGVQGVSPESRFQTVRNTLKPLRGTLIDWAPQGAQGIYFVADGAPAAVARPLTAKPSRRAPPQQQPIPVAVVSTPTPPASFTSDDPVIAALLGSRTELLRKIQRINVALEALGFDG